MHMAEHTEAADRYVKLASRHFAERGYTGVSLAAIAREAKVTKQALLHFFGTKERLYAAVLSALATRLCTEIDELPGERAEDRLMHYFERQGVGSLQDARLVIRALLESDETAKIWPLKPYLDKLVVLALQTERWQGAAQEEVLAGLYQLIGASQYFSISTPTLSGMYGTGAMEALHQHTRQNAKEAVASFLGR
ncbi:MAG: TetR family transcriptional regulator [Rhodobacteraceae bacterium]|nr:TetR family transcriptional regulator [Paracoccaceae bacterium]